MTVYSPLIFSLWYSTPDRQKCIFRGWKHGPPTLHVVLSHPHAIPIGAKKQKFGSFEKQLAPKFLFGYLATFWYFCNFFIPQIFLGDELRVVGVSCP